MDQKDNVMSFGWNFKIILSVRMLEDSLFFIFNWESLGNKALISIVAIDETYKFMYYVLRGMGKIKVD